MMSRRIFVLILLCISFPLSARQVFRGENLWKLQKQVTEASCDATITQDNIPLTISRPGVYCLAESVSFADDIVITITATENVVLDLNGHEVKHTEVIPSLDKVCILVSSSTHVIIKKGFLEEQSVAGRSCSIEDCEKVVINSMNITNTGQLAFGSQVKNSSGVVIKQCLYNGGAVGISFIGSLDCIVKNCAIRNTSSLGIIFDDASIQSCVSCCKVFSANGSNFTDSGTSNSFLSCIAKGGSSAGFSLGAKGLAQHCIAYDCSVVGFLLSEDKGLVRDCIAVNNGTGIRIEGSECQVIGNSVIGTGEGADIGIKNAGTGSRIFNNLVHDYGTNYDGVDANTIELVPTTSTGYWANVSQ